MEDYLLDVNISNILAFEQKLASILQDVHAAEDTMNKMKFKEFKDMMKTTVRCNILKLSLDF